MVEHLPNMFKDLGSILDTICNSKPKLSILLPDCKDANTHCITFKKGMNLVIKMYGQYAVKFSSRIIH